MSDEDESLPPKTRDQALWVGLFIIGAIVLTMGLLFTMTDAALFRGRYIVTTRVPDAGGIRRGDPVQMRGVGIGRVMGFSIDKGGVTLRLEIEGEYPVPTDSKVQLRSAGLLGGMVADVEPGSATQMLRYGDTLAGTAEEPMMSATQRLMDEASGAISRVDGMLSDKLVADVQAGSAELHSLLKSLSVTVKEQRQELLALETSLKKNSEGLERVTTGPELERAVKRLDEIGARADEVSASLGRSSKTLEELLGRLERGEGTLGKLSKDEALYKDLDGAARSIEQAGTDVSTLVADIRKNPKKYLKFSVF
jgi:phospholipid/cholesterol/gamma-HCH transport system substrate-binding protein